MATSIVRRTCQRSIWQTGQTSVSVTHALTNVPIAETSAALLAKQWLGDGTIARRSHYVRDGTPGEDRNHMPTGNAPPLLAALRNSLRARWRRAGWKRRLEAYD